MKTEKLRKLLALLLVSAIVILPACSSGDGSGDNTVTTAAPTTTADPTVTIEAEITGPTLGFAKEDNQQYSFNILAAKHQAYEFNASEFTGEIVNDAVFERNQAVMDYLGIKINMIEQAGNWAQRNEFNALITNDIAANNMSYDLVSGVAVVTMPLATQGMLMDVTELDYLDLTNDWWVQGLEDDLGINGKLCMAVGDANLSMYKNFAAVFFPQDMIAKYQMEDPYTLVRNGEWTLDKFLSMAEQVSVDLNNDGKITLEDDELGYYSQQVLHRAWQTATEVGVISKNETGDFTVLSLSERFVDLYDKMLAFTQGDSAILMRSAVDMNDITRAVAENRCLFMLNYLYAAESEHLRNMTSDYGLVPYPKYDSRQSDYHTQVATGTSIFFVPLTVNNEALTAKTMEALSFFSTDSVVPAFYETAMKEKYARDPNVAEMLEIIRSSARVTFDALYSTTFSPNVVCILQQTGAITSYWDTNKSVWEKTLASIIESYN